MTLAGIRCVGYVRVSTDRQAGEDRTSPADQRTAIEARAAKLGLTVGRWYQDESSGKNAEQRPALRQLIADCEADPRTAKLPGYVIALNDSRWGRFPDPEESAYWRTHLRKRCGWLVWFAENDDAADPKLRTVMRAIVATQATQKREDVQQNARRGSRGAASQGYWGTRDVYGFRRKVVYPPDRIRVLAPGQRKAIDEKVKLDPHEPEASVVRAMFRRYASGTESVGSLTDWLRETVPARAWTRPAVKFTLANPAYVGDVVSGRVSVESRERRPDSEWVTHRNAHPPIIDRETFQRCQDMLARNAKWTTRVRSHWLVSGLVQCPCGKHYVAGGSNRNKRHEETRSYRCATKAGAKSQRCPFPGSVKKEWLERYVVDTVASVVGSLGMKRRVLASLDRALASVRSAPTDHLLAVTKRLTDATAARDRLVAAVADGTLTGEEARGRLGDARRLIIRLESERDTLTAVTGSADTLNAERDALALAMTDFKTMSRRATGPDLRELVRPWIRHAVFDPRTRDLTLEIRHIPAFASSALASMACPPDQKDSATSHVTRRTVRVGGGR